MGNVPFHHDVQQWVQFLAGQSDVLLVVSCDVLR